jgi:hypothetical protein
MPNLQSVERSALGFSREFCATYASALRKAVRLTSIESIAFERELEKGTA